MKHQTYKSPSSFTQLHMIQNKIQQFKNNLSQMEKKKGKKTNNVFTSLVNQKKGSLKLKESDMNTLSHHSQKYTSPKFTQPKMFKGMSRHKSPEVTKQKSDINLFSFISPKGQKENTSIFQTQKTKNTYLSAKHSQFTSGAYQYPKHY